MLAPQRLSSQARKFPGLRIDNIDGTVLAAIVNAKVEKLHNFTPAPVPQHLKNTVSLQQALSGPGRHFILECKRASPSLGDINLQLDFRTQVKCYNRYAAAISVLTEETYFKGSYDFLKQVKKQTHLPVILKDFVIDARELINARHIGADAVLLMTSLLTQDKFLELYDIAYALGLEVLCEVSDEREADFARDAQLKVVGINNRNLKTLQIDLNTVAQLQPRLSPYSVVVSESGIKQHADFKRLPMVQNFLIGSAVCTPQLYPDTAVKSLLFGMNKICGLATTDGVQAALQAKASLAGLIFAPKSPRCVTLSQAQRLIALDVDQVLSFCGVFVNAQLDEVLSIVDALNLPFVQLHGQENVDYVQQLHVARPLLNIIKALPASADIAIKAEPYLRLQTTMPLYMLYDGANPGSGLSYDYKILQAQPHSRALLAGGLNIANVKMALAQGFAGLDLNSGLERAPGDKDPALVAQAFMQINQY